MLIYNSYIYICIQSAEKRDVRPFHVLSPLPPRRQQPVWRTCVKRLEMNLNTLSALSFSLSPRPPFSSFFLKWPYPICVSPIMYVIRPWGPLRLLFTSFYCHSLALYTTWAHRNKEAAGQVYAYVRCHFLTAFMESLFHANNHSCVKVEICSSHHQILCVSRVQVWWITFHFDVKGRLWVLSLLLVYSMVNIRVLLTVSDSFLCVVKRGDSYVETEYHRVALAKRDDSQTRRKEKMQISWVATSFT